MDRARFCLHLPVGGDHGPVPSAFSQSFQAVTDGVVGAISEPHKMCSYGTKFSGPGLTGWRTIEEDFHLFLFHSAKFLQDGDQFHLVVDRVQAQPQLGDEIMSVDQIRHIQLYLVQTCGFQVG